MRFRFRGQLHVTAVVKATFAFVPEAPMRLVAPDDLLPADVHHGGDPRRSLRGASDLALHRARVDVVLTGHAHILADDPGRRTVARIALHRGRVILDKALHVVASPGAAGALEAVPLLYERAFGGPGCDENPIGTGLAPGSAPPNLVDLGGGRRAVGFGPIAASWPARRRLLGPLDPRLLEQPIVELPSDFDWSFFQASPLDQRLDALHGDEWLLLEGFHPALPQIRSQLPAAQCAAAVHGLGGPAARPLGLLADGLIIDVDRRCCSVTWRARFPVSQEDALAKIVLSIGIRAGAPALRPSPVTLAIASPPVVIAPPAPAKRPPKPAVKPDFPDTSIRPDPKARALPT